MFFPQALHPGHPQRLEKDDDLADDDGLCVLRDHQRLQRSGLLERVRSAIQLHRRRLSRLYARSDRQHFRVLSDGSDDPRHAGSIGNHLLVHDPKACYQRVRNRQSGPVYPYLHRNGRRSLPEHILAALGLPQPRQRQCLRDPASGERLLGLPGGIHEQRARLRAVLQHAP